jgi:hypothetical protein
MIVLTRRLATTGDGSGGKLMWEVVEVRELIAHDEEQRAMVIEGCRRRLGMIYETNAMMLAKMFLRKMSGTLIESITVACATRKEMVTVSPK